jgi:hypothetical protein
MGAFRKDARVDAPRADWSPKSLSLLLALTILAFLIMGYHPGLEDDAFYLAAIKHDLNPSLFPHDADFFRVQFQATIFDKLIAFSIRLTHLPVAWAELLWQLLAIFLLLHGCRRIARRCFRDPPAQWAAASLVAVLLTIPVSGTGITLADQYLHPRTLATAAILAAIVNVMDYQKNGRHWWRVGIWLSVAFAIHAIMASFGISLCFFLWWAQRASARKTTSPTPTSARITGAIFLPVGLVLPLKWIFEPASDAWRQAAATRSFYFISRWAWYEWLGIFVPVALLYAFARWAPHRAQAVNHNPENDGNLLTLVWAVIYYAIFQTVVGLAIMLPPSLERLRPFEPMRYLHLVYLFFFLIVGGILGRYVLGRHAYRWALLFVPLGAGMFYAQRQMFPATAHLELPGRTPTNAWLQAFAWIRQYTPLDGYFALDPRYVELPGEDYHGFRALAERSVLADAVKDGGMAARVPSLAPRWLKEVTAERGWQDFGDEDFLHLKKEFGVDWIVLDRTNAVMNVAPVLGLVLIDPGSFEEFHPNFKCPYKNEQVFVCRLY